MGFVYLPPVVARRVKAHEYLKTLDFAELADNPMCPRCERVACRDEGYSDNKNSRCPYCGAVGTMPVTLREYAAKVMYK